MLTQLYVVRHGQASLHGNHYDQLSSLGERQAKALAEYWLDRGLTWDRVFVGPRQRHHQTEAAVAAVYRAKGKPWPQATILGELDEHQGFQLFEHMLAQSEDLLALRQRIRADKQRVAKDELKRFFKEYQRLTRLWVKGELEVDGFESWIAFRQRVARAMQVLGRPEHRSGRTVAFTSGGPVAMSTGLALGLTDERILELSWEVRNIASADFRLSSEGTRLHCFNVLPYFRDKSLETQV